MTVSYDKFFCFLAYGFDGLSYEYISGRLQKRLPALARGRAVAAHLGSGVRMCTPLNGATMVGFSALDMLVMTTRCGCLDLSVLLYLGAQGHGFSEIEDMLYHRSGLAGVSGIGGDVCVLLDSGDPYAREAIDLFTDQIAIKIGGLASALGGVDGLAFTAGIGEHAPEIRAAACERFAWIRIQLDAPANAANVFCSSTPESCAAVHVIATDEEAMIARHMQTTHQPHILQEVTYNGPSSHHQPVGQAQVCLRYRQSIRHRHRIGSLMRGRPKR